MLINSEDPFKITRLIKNYVGEDTALITVGEKTNVDIHKLIFFLNEQTINFIGGIFPMVVYENDVNERGIVIHRLTNVINISTIKNISQKKYTIPPINFEPNNNYSLITFVDGLTSNISTFLSNLYENYGMQTTYFGGGAGSLSLKQKPCVFSKNGFFKDAAVVCVNKMKSNIGVKHGWKKLDGPFIVTKAHQNTIEEINWENPFSTYKKVVEKNANTNFDDQNFFELASGYPLGIIKEGAEHIIRDPLSVKDDRFLICVGQVEENTMINIMKGENKSLINAAKIATEEVVNQTKKAKNAIIIDCISRILYLKDDFKYELEAVSKTIKNKFPDIQICGALTLGEISSYGNGYIEFYNKTIVVGLFE